MSSLNYCSLLAAGLACLAPLTAAYTQPVGAQPSGNPISQPGLNTIVPAGENFTITWEPTTKGTVTLLLLKGPSTNAVPQYAIVEKTENDGSYVWSVKDDLEPSAAGVAQGYGIQLIDDATGQYQYTTQFGISNDDYKKGSESSSSSSSTSSWSAKTTDVAPPSYGGKASSSAVTTTTIHTTTSAAHTPVGTGSFHPSHNVTMVAPTGSTPTTVSTAPTYNMPNATATTTTPPQQTGAASTLAGSVFGALLAAGVAVLAM